MTTSILKKRADRVVEYVRNNPGCTAREISYNSNVALNTVHRIIENDARALELAEAGKIAVLDRHMKPKWYRPSMSKALVKKDRFDPGARLRQMAENDSMAPEAKRIVGAVAQALGNSISHPGRSVLSQRRDAVAAISETQALALSYTEVKTENEQVIPRIAHLENMVHRLTVSDVLDKRYGKSDLRKTVRK